MTIIAIVTPSERDFKYYKISNSEPNTELVHVSNLNQCYDLKIHEYVSITNVAKMQNLNLIIEELKKRIL